MRLLKTALSYIAGAVLLCSCLVIPLVLAEAQEQPPASIEKPAAEKSTARSASDRIAADKSSSGAYVMQLVMSLVVVVLAIVLLAWLMKRLNRLPGRVAGNMRVLGAMSLGARERAVLVQVGDTQMLLGVSPGRVNTLHVFDEPVVDASSFSGVPATSFASILNNLGKGGGR